MEWQEAFRERMHRFSIGHGGKGLGISIKFRIFSGCFHRVHSPEAYSLIDQALLQHGGRIGSVELVEHETGPEVLVHLGLITGGLALVTGLLQLVVAIMQARAAGIAKGDKPHDPVEVIIRRIIEGGKFEELILIRKGNRNPISTEELTAFLKGSMTDQKIPMVSLVEKPAQGRKPSPRRSRKLG